MAPPFGSDSDEREKPSWREIDRRRDRSRHVRREESGSKEKSLRSAWAKERYLKEVDKLFQGEKGSKAHKAALNAIHRTYGTQKFSDSINKYLEKYGIPDDWSTLMLLLDCKEPGTVIQAIQELKTLYPQQGLEEQQGFRSKLNIISMTTKDDELRHCAEEAAADL